jgi:hypothetical protein
MGIALAALFGYNPALGRNAGGARVIRILKESERGCIFRLGRFHRVAGPGPVLLFPLIDRIAPVDLSRVIPEWRDVLPEELEAMVEFLVTHYPEIPPHLTVAERRTAMYLGDGLASGA